jgi:hypothetical protein
MKQEDALLLILKWLRASSPSRHANFGYDIYLPNVIHWHLSKEQPNIQSQEEHHALRDLYPIFVDAAWELCRRGIIRPGVKEYGAQTTDDGAGGSGYSITRFGRQWLEEEDEDVFVPTEPGRFAEMMKPFRARFGAGFYDRSQEAIRCYGAHAYLACCAMCGAAAESILLATATNKTNNENQVLKAYTTANGRKRVESMVVGQAKEHIKREFQGLTELLKYWRDEAAHGKASQISDNEAYTSLAMLLRYAMFVNENWDDLTK